MTCRNTGKYIFILGIIFFIQLFSIGVYAENSTESVPVPVVYGNLPVGMEASCGYDGTIKGGRFIPVTIKLSNQQETEFNGKIKILSMETDYGIYRYEYPVSVEAASDKEFKFNIPTGFRADQLYVILTDNNDTEMIRKRIKMNVNFDVSELMIGVLSDSSSQLQYLNGVGINYSSLRTKTVMLDEESVAEDALGLDMFDALIITDFDTEKLNENQRSAIDTWIDRGGTLILGTGEHADYTLAAFSGSIRELQYGESYNVSVDMGVEYSTSGPGDSSIEIPCINLSMRGGNVLLSSDELPVLTVINKEKGMIAVTAYDFADIEKFAQENPSYIEKIFVNLLGEERINQLSQSIYGGDNDTYWSVQNAINTGSAGKLPNIPLYVAVIIIYIVFAGPGLYILLKRYGLNVFYRSTAVTVAAVFTIIIYMMGNQTRFKDTFFTYATIKEISADEIAEQTIVNIRNPYNKPYSVEMNPQYTVFPVTRSYYYDMTAAPQFNGNEAVKSAIAFEEEGTNITISDSAAFSSQYFQLNRKTDNENQERITGNITIFDGKVSGSITNGFSYAVEDAAILFNGQIVLIGELAAGETRELSDNDTLYYIPVGNSGVTAEKITGGDKYLGADISDAKYLKSLERIKVIIYYMDNYSLESDENARVIAFSTEKEKNDFLTESKYKTYGSTMLTSSVAVETKVNGLISKVAKVKNTASNIQNYNELSNSIYGADPVVIEYSLGSELDVERITFNKLSPEFTENPKYDYLRLFTGDVYFYNYDMGSYDIKKIDKNTFNKKDLVPYLSPSNTLTVKYIPKAAEYNWSMMLPMVNIVGREK